eukprot:3281684-Prymnesium_polylepis.2
MVRVALAATGKDPFAERRGAARVVVDSGQFDAKEMWLSKSGLVDDHAKEILLGPEHVFSLEGHPGVQLAPYFFGVVGAAGMLEMGSFNDAFIFAYVVGGPAHDGSNIMMLPWNGLCGRVLTKLEGEDVARRCVSDLEWKEAMHTARNNARTVFEKALRKPTEQGGALLLDGALVEIAYNTWMELGGADIAAKPIAAKLTVDRGGHVSIALEVLRSAPPVSWS